MIRRTPLLSLSVLVLLLVATTWVARSNAPAQVNREELWKKVDEAQNKGLPKTAIEHINPIIEGAMADKAYAEAIKAIGRKIALEGVVQGNKPEEKVKLMEAEIAKAPKEMVPMMDAILAHWYWQYFQQNRWRFMQRTQTAAAPGKDFTTWDLARIFAEIDKQFTKALSNVEQLKKTPISEYDALLDKGTVPDTYRPTLYDFLAHEALAFYSSGEQAAAKPQDAFELPAESPIFAPVAEFLAWDLKTADDQAPVAKAIRLYQDLTRFHEKDQDKGAFLDVDLERLVFGFNKAYGEEKNARYKAALKRYVDQWGDHEISARARFHWATVLQQENDLVEAHKLALQGAQAFANTIGGNMCHNLVQQIEAKSSQVTTERVWSDPLPTIDVRYRNVSEVHFRAIRVDWLERIKNAKWNWEWLDDNQRKAMLARKPDLEWAAKLPATEDFRERVEELPAPKDLKAGFYFLLASHDPRFGDQNNVVSFTTFWVSELALVMRTRGGEGLVEGFVLRNGSGEPVEGAQVQAWQRTNQGNFEAGPATKTGANGLFSISTANRGLLVHATHQDQQLATANEYSSYVQNQIPRANQQTIFFTDRSLYRPGQTVHYKGICINVDQEGNNYKAIAGQTLRVIFQDVNGKEIERQEQKTNDYGSFSGSFTAPRDRLMGRMTIRVDNPGPHGAASFNVEEYKRPKFQVTLDAPKTAAKLNEKVGLEGKAAAYTGAAVDGAKIRYRVVRQVRYPDWWYWSFWWRAPQTSSREIIHGTAETKTDGTFSIEFTALPDPSVPEKDEPVFQFTVYADVTDTAGETRSANRTVNVGYTALKASLSAADWQTADAPMEITVTTQTLDDEPQKADVAMKIHRLKQPEKVHRASLSGPRYSFMPRRAGKVAQVEEPKPDLSNPNSWELGEVVVNQGVTTDDKGKAALTAKLPAGAYRVVAETQDRFGKKVKALLPIQVLAPDAKGLAIKIPNVVAAPKWSLEPGEEFMALWGTGYEKARAYVEIEHRRKIIQSFWTEPGASQQPVKLAVTEAMRGGFTLRVTMVRENRGYLTSRKVDVPWTNKNLSVKWEHFVSKLEPARKETWTAVITGPDAKKAVAEMVAALYDQSLDAYLPHAWRTGFGVFYQDYSNISLQFENQLRQLNHLFGHWPMAHKPVDLRYRSFPQAIIANLWGYGYFGEGKGRGARALAGGAPPPMAAAPADGLRRNRAAEPQVMMEKSAAMDAAPAMETRAAARKSAGDKDEAAKRFGADAKGDDAGAAGPDLSKVSARKNLNETAFFFPHLLSDKDGQVKLEFTMPEALTQWKFLGFAHDAELRAGLLEDKVVTAKDLMVQPNPPRFLREGDALEFTVKVTNQSDKPQAGKVRLTISNARTGAVIDEYYGIKTPDQEFDIPAKESRTFSWPLTVPDGAGPIAYKTVGATDKLSDGEEGMLPILSSRVLVTESLPLPIRGPETKKFEFTKLLKSGESKTLRNQSLTVQMVSNPSWYAVMALPYLMEFPYECSEQVFNRLYANSLARHIAQSDPKIRKVFDQWKGTPALDSPLEKNQDLKAVLLEETPWVRQAQAESQARKNVGILFDDNRLNEETSRLMRKISEMQLPDGAWPWFPGGPPNDYITLYITNGFGRLRHLGVKLDVAPAVKSLNRLDGWIDQMYREILKRAHKDDNHLSSLIALYLYARSFFLEDKPIAANHREAVDYFLGQARKYWLQLNNRQSQAHLAVALKRFGDKDAAQGIMKSIKERSVNDEELGMFWRDLELSWWWFRAPIETQAMMIEAFAEVMDDEKSVEDCKVWLLKQKQTQDWKTTKATADAVYALLLRGEKSLASDELVEVVLGKQVIKPENVEAGTGFYEQKFLRSEVTPDLGQITVKKVDKGVAWGSVHWQYLEDMSKVTPYEGTPLKLQKSVYTREHTKKGPVLEEVKGPVKVGEELVMRIVLRTDRDMEYVHLKDYRGSGTEPVNVLSRYKYQDGLAYYETTRDAASHFFIDYLPKGTYVFEYAVRVQHRGKYQTGFASIQCMYAPEFNSHSESVWLEVK